HTYTATLAQLGTVRAEFTVAPSA
ncbi:MAG: hypothetical protein QOE19_1225, partial [Actinomycetota bacterium]|nr:hypothetical protein [Actinomycetota bacterium]